MNSNLALLSFYKFHRTVSLGDAIGTSGTGFSDIEQSIYYDYPLGLLLSLGDYKAAKDIKRPLVLAMSVSKERIPLEIHQAKGLREIFLKWRLREDL